MNPLDPHNMYQMISSFPGQFAEGFSAASELADIATPEQVIITGMGGSALPADIVQAAFSDRLKHPLIVSRNYTLPVNATPDSLIIAISFSGNTEETISAYQTAKAIGSQVVVVTTGGQILDLAKANNDPWIEIPKPSAAFQPRMASGYIFAIISAILVRCGFLADCHDEVLTAASNLQGNWAEAEAKPLSQTLVGKIPVIYTSDTYWPVARIGKIKFNENSKTPAFWNVFPELNHNEMVGFTNSQALPFHTIMLRDLEDDVRVVQRMPITAQVLATVNPNLHSSIIDMPGDTKLEKIFNSLMLLDWTSYYLALANNIDPTPVALVEDFKQALVAPGAL